MIDARVLPGEEISVRNARYRIVGFVTVLVVGGFVLMGTPHRTSAETHACYTARKGIEQGLSDGIWGICNTTKDAQAIRKLIHKAREQLLNQGCDPDLLTYPEPDDCHF